MRSRGVRLAAATLLFSANAPTPPAHAQDAAETRGDDELSASQGLDVITGDDGLDGRDGVSIEVPVATAYAPTMIASADTCMGSTTGGVQVLSVGVSVGQTWQDDNCRRIKNARQLASLGYQRAAVALLCVDDEVREAMYVAGTPCPGDPRLVPAVATSPIPAPPSLQPEQTLTLYSVHFDFDSARLKPDSEPALQDLLARVQEHPDYAIDIEGHTDFVGTDEYNLGLSQRRAQAVVDWLEAHGVTHGRIRAIGRGEAEPIATNDSAEGRAQNRRVEIIPHAPDQTIADGGDLIRNFP